MSQKFWPRTFNFFNGLLGWANDQAQYKIISIVVYIVQVYFFQLRLCTTLHNYSVAHPQMPHLKSAHGRTNSSELNCISSVGVKANATHTHCTQSHLELETLIIPSWRVTDDFAVCD